MSVFGRQVPVVGLAADWNLLWHHYRSIVNRCEVVLTDVQGVEVMHEAGIEQARAANLFGLSNEYLTETWAEDPRDIDVVFVGNLSPTVQGERLPWLARLAQLSDRRHVVIATGVRGREYRDLLRRSKIVFNHSLRGESNLRAFEAPACGCLLFQEAENREIRDWLRPGEEFVPYTASDLESLLESYLADDHRLRAVAEAGRARVQHCSFDQIWSRIVEQLHVDWPAIQQRAVHRAASEPAAASVSLPSVLAGLLKAESLANANRVEEAIHTAKHTLGELEKTLEFPTDVELWTSSFNGSTVG